jgi:17beta-estradiol 17-dehydrogenase / very-long-chain 3-oxoacyl-CoA reductase
MAVYLSIFPLLLTRALLPTLRARQGPAHVMFVGSQSANISIPRFTIYASSKNFIKALARCLDADEHWPVSHRQGVSFMYLNVGEVVSSTMQITPGLFAPTSERFAKAVVARIGCGRKQITPWMPHAVLEWFMTMLGESIVERFTRQEVSKLLAMEDDEGGLRVRHKYQ